jgi:hypothetical protein
VHLEESCSEKKKKVDQALRFSEFLDQIRIRFLLGLFYGEARGCSDGNDGDADYRSSSTVGLSMVSTAAGAWRHGRRRSRATQRHSLQMDEWLPHCYHFANPCGLAAAMLSQFFFLSDFWTNKKARVKKKTVTCWAAPDINGLDQVIVPHRSVQKHRYMENVCTFQEYRFVITGEVPKITNNRLQLLW